MKNDGKHLFYKMKQLRLFFFGGLTQESMNVSPLKTFPKLSIHFSLKLKNMNPRAIKQGGFEKER